MNTFSSGSISPILNPDKTIEADKANSLDVNTGDLNVDNLDFQKFYSVLQKTLSADTTFTASNLSIGHKIILTLNGNYNIKFPDNFYVEKGIYNPYKTNVLELTVIDSNPGSEKVYIRINPLNKFDQIQNLPTPTHVLLSLRKLNPSYSGSAVRIRRESDDTEIDIGFDSNGNLDNSALESFAAGYNMLGYTEDLNNAKWEKTSNGTGSNPIVTTNNALSPIGDMTADTVQFDLNGGNTSTDQSNLRQKLKTVTGEAYTFSVWMRSDTPTNIIMDFNGLTDGDRLKSVTNTWQRYTTTVNSVIDESRWL